MRRAEDEGVLDPWVAEQMEVNPFLTTPLEDFSPEILELARTVSLGPPTVDIAHVTDELVDDVPVRVYVGAREPAGLVVYFHGGGFVLGGIEVMDGVARELARCANAAVVSVGYRLAPEHPFPAGLDDCESVTRWALANTNRFGVPDRAVAVAGESAGGNLAAAVSLRLRDAGDVALAGQVLVYPAIDGGRMHPSREEFAGLVLSRKQMDYCWEAYSGGSDIAAEPYAAPLQADRLAGLPPALLILGGCDVLRDEGRAYAGRMRDANVDVEEICYPGQPHGFVNFGFPAATAAYEKIGTWMAAHFAAR
jgi:acetyl esterase